MTYPRDRLRSQLVDVDRDLDAALAKLEAATRQAEAAAEARIDLGPHLTAMVQSTEAVAAVARRGLATLELVLASVPAGASLAPSAVEWIARQRREFSGCIEMAERPRSAIRRRLSG